MKDNIEIGDIVSPGFYGPDAYGVVLDVSVPKRRTVHSGFKPRAKILMHTGKVYYFVLEDLTIVSKGNNNDAF